ncbi:MAG: FAD binding domain-containing protein [Elusimicrobiales bacterium]|nr:FAD binding domain-containing protein [Elusimicrobiales bacterium]
MKNLKYCCFPQSVEEAVKLLSDKKHKSIAVAGGTLIAKSIGDSIEQYVDIRYLPLKYIKVSGGDLIIGALCAFDEIDDNPFAKKWASGVLSKAAAKCSSQLIRNMATIGGNIAKPHSFNIFPALLCALNAKVKVAFLKGVKTYPIEDIYNKDFPYKLGFDSIITEIIIPAYIKNCAANYEKFSKTQSCWESYASCAFSVLMIKGKVEKPRVIIGSLSPKPIRLEAAEGIISNQKLSSKIIEEAMEAFIGNLDILKLSGIGIDFKKEVACIMFKRFLTGLAEDKI